MVIFNLYTLVDGIFVAHYEGDTALASINVASPYVTTIFSIGVLFAIGSSTVMSIYRGANEERKMHEVFTMNTITISCVALCIAVLSFINSHHITEFLGANSDVFNYTDTYVNFPQYLYIYTNKHPVVLSQRVFFYDSFNACTILLTLSI